MEYLVGANAPLHFAVVFIPQIACLAVPFVDPSPGFGGNNQSLLHISHLRVGMDHRLLHGSIPIGSVGSPARLKLNEVGWDSHVETMSVKEAPPRPLYAMGIPKLTLQFSEGCRHQDGFKLCEYVIPIICRQCPCPIRAPKGPSVGQSFRSQTVDEPLGPCEEGDARIDYCITLFLN